MASQGIENHIHDAASALKPYGPEHPAEWQAIEDALRQVRALSKETKQGVREKGSSGKGEEEISGFVNKHGCVLRF